MAEVFKPRRLAFPRFSNARAHCAPPASLASLMAKARRSDAFAATAPALSRGVVRHWGPHLEPIRHGLRRAAAVRRPRRGPEPERLGAIVRAAGAGKRSAARRGDPPPSVLLKRLLEHAGRPESERHRVRVSRHEACPSPTVAVKLRPAPMFARQVLRDTPALPLSFLPRFPVVRPHKTHFRLVASSLSPSLIWPLWLY